MQTQIENNPSSAMLNEVRQAREAARTTAKTGEGGNPNGQADELPEGTSPLEASAEAPVAAEETSPEAPTETEGDTVAAAAETGEPIIIGDREFTSEKEALKYAQQIEQERLRTEAHSAGIREALEATRVQANPTPPPEDDFEQRFYSNPKETLKTLKEEATREALQVIKQEQNRENLWSQFLNEHPDIRRSDAERMLQTHWETIGKMTDLPKAMKVLASKVRADYAEITEMMKPRTVLADKKQVLSPSGGAPRSVTPTKKEDAPLAFTAQMRAAFKR